jgi:hypothetical protein
LPAATADVQPVVEPAAGVDTALARCDVLGLCVLFVGEDALLLEQAPRIAIDATMATPTRACTQPVSTFVHSTHRSH